MRKAKFTVEQSRGEQAPLDVVMQELGPPEPLLITMIDLERVLGSSKTTCFRLVGTGQIESVQIGRKRMPVWESVKAYVDRLRQASKGPMQEAA